jgi:hypothetical protein
MKFPDVNDFLEEFGMEPVEVDPALALCRYTKKSKNSEIEVDVSFSAVMKSFQMVLRLSMQELAVVSSENVKSIELVGMVPGLDFMLYLMFASRFRKPE